MRALQAEVDALQRGWGERVDGDRQSDRIHRAEGQPKGSDNGSFVPDDRGSRKRSRGGGGDGGGRCGRARGRN
ncbi:hypothetical protein, partial [Nocardia sp. 852002-51244_SCH5132740]|uniref:hypothetical protein n=1 Tax=Nocardia sp. 852002-51244_SCH5132740 TaxID=1834099 RepID=UPI001E511D8F